MSDSFNTRRRKPGSVARRRGDESLTLELRGQHGIPERTARPPHRLHRNVGHEHPRDPDVLSKAFGWKFTDYGPEYTSFEDGRLAGGFHAGGPTGGNGVLVVIYAVDLADAEKRVRDAGGTVVKPVFDFPGGRRFHFKDPSGNELAVWSDK